MTCYIPLMAYIFRDEFHVSSKTFVNTSVGYTRQGRTSVEDTWPLIGRPHQTVSYTVIRLFFLQMDRHFFKKTTYYFTWILMFRMSKDHSLCERFDKGSLDTFKWVSLYLWPRGQYSSDLFSYDCHIKRPAPYKPKKMFLFENPEINTL